MKTNQYAEYLDSEHWRQFRIQYRVKRAWECAIEGCISEDLELHHLTYERLWRERLDDVIPLCHGHHEEAHVLVDVVGKDLRTAHLFIGRSGVASDPEGFLFLELMHGLGAVKFGGDNDDELAEWDIPLARKRKKLVSAVAKSGAYRIRKGSHPDGVLNGCLNAVKANQPEETEFWIALALIEGGHV